MEKNRRMLTVFAAILMLFVALAVGFYWSTSAFGGTAPEIVLPTGSPEDTTVDPSEDVVPEELLVSGLSLLEITPENISETVATLARPERYSMEVEATLFYEGGEGTVKSLCYTMDGYTKTETLNEAGIPEVHIITGPERVYIWRAGESRYYTGARGEISADDVQRIPTYEDVLDLLPEQILSTDFEEYAGQSCIFISYYDNETGYTERWWISVETGLLAGAEKADAEGKLLYRMTVSKFSGEPEPEAFRLPNQQMVQEIDTASG